MSIVDCLPIKQGTHDELCTFADTIEHNINCLKDPHQYDIGSFISSILASKLNKRLSELWLHYSRDVKEVPDIDTLLQFLKECIRTTPISMSLPLKPDPPRESTKRVKAPVHSIHSRESRDSKDSCMVCGGDRHSIYLCSTFRPMSTDAKHTYVKSNHLCFNCLYPGHRTKECRSSGRCKHCGKMHQVCWVCE